MIRLLIGFGIFIIWIAFARNYYLCEIKGLCGPPATDVDSTYLTNIPRTLHLTAGRDTLLKNYPQFYFDYASHAYTYIDGNEKFLNQVATFLQTHPDPDIKLIIEGAYLADEQEAVASTKRFNDLGLARAQAIADKLMEEYRLGKPRFQVRSVLAKTNPIVAPLRFRIIGYTPELEAANADTALLAQLKTSIADITYTDKNASFEYNSGRFVPNASFGIYLDSLQQYLGRYPDHFILVIGHTDSKGGTTYNQRLGLKRAQSVRQYLLDAGIEVPVRVRSAGEEQPLVSDQNEDGSYDIEAMAKNRRVNIIIKPSN